MSLLLAGAIFVRVLYVLAHQVAQYMLMGMGFSI